MRHAQIARLKEIRERIEERRRSAVVAESDNGSVILQVDPIDQNILDVIDALLMEHPIIGMDA